MHWSGKGCCTVSDIPRRSSSTISHMRCSRMPCSILATTFAPSRAGHSMFLISSSTSRQIGCQIPDTSGVITSSSFTTLLFLLSLSEHLETWQELLGGDRLSNWKKSGCSFLLEFRCSSIVWGSSAVSGYSNSAVSRRKKQLVCGILVDVSDWKSETIDKTLQFAVHTDGDPYWFVMPFPFAFYEFLDHVKWPLSRVFDRTRFLWGRVTIMNIFSLCPTAFTAFRARAWRDEVTWKWGFRNLDYTALETD